MRAPPRLAHETDGVRIIHHHQRAVLFRQVANRWKVRDVAVHRKHAVRRDHFEARVACRLQLHFEVSHVIVFVALPLRFAEPDAVNDAGVIQLIRNDRVLRAQ